MVCTRGQALNLVPCADGVTTVENIGKYDGEDTRVEVQLGRDAGPIDLGWASRAKISSKGQHYRGKASPGGIHPEIFTSCAWRQRIRQLVILLVSSRVMATR
jgi:hypothetical protein